MSENRDEDGRLRITAPTTRHGQDGAVEADTLYSDRPFGFSSQPAKPDGNVYVFAPGAWLSPTQKFTPAQARAHAAALLEAADAVEGKTWPQGAPRPDAGDSIVQVLMTEEMARRFEARCLGKGNTVGHTKLSGPLLFRENDLPTYIIGVADDA